MRTTSNHFPGSPSTFDQDNVYPFYKFLTLRQIVLVNVLALDWDMQFKQLSEHVVCG